jgi:hypothetical protein
METLKKNKKKGKVGAPYGNKNCQGHQNNLKWTEEKALELGNELLEWMMPNKRHAGMDKNGNPIIVDDNIMNVQFQKFILMKKNLDVNIMSELSKKYSSFKEIIKKAKELQKIKTFDLLFFSKRMNTAAGIFFLKANCGLSEKNLVEHSGGLEISTKLSFEEIDKKINKSDKQER